MDANRSTEEDVCPVCGFISCNCNDEVCALCAEEPCVCEELKDHEEPYEGGA